MTDEQTIMSIIANSGDSISYTMKAMLHAKAENKEEYETAMKNSLLSLQKAHQLHTELLVREARGEDIKVSTLLVHASTHMANAELARMFAEILESLLIKEEDLI